MIANPSIRPGFLAMGLFLAIVADSPTMAEKKDDDSGDDRDSSSSSVKLKTQSASNQSQHSLDDLLGHGGGKGDSLFGAGEWDVIGFGAGGFGQDSHDVTEEHTVRTTKIVTDTRLETRTLFQNVFVPGGGRVPGPGHFELQAMQTRVPVTTTRKVTTSHTVKTSKNVAGIQDGFGGAGAEARFYFTRCLGLGLEGDWLQGGHGAVGSTMTTFTARLIKDANAFYAFGGFGVQFDEHHTQSIGKLGLGVEHRLPAGIGLFADGAWLFGANENAAVFRAGARVPLK